MNFWKVNFNMKNWLEWRHDGLGASDAPVILGISKYKKIEELLAEKIGPCPKPSPANYIQQKGQEAEPVARALYELDNFVNMPAAFLESKTDHWLRASMDGWDQVTLTGIEIKLIGKPEPTAQHFAQIQHQILVSGATCIDWVGIKNGAITVIRVYPDKVFLDNYFLKAKSFWAEVLDGRGLKK